MRMSCWREQKTRANDRHPSTNNNEASSSTLGVHGVTWSFAFCSSRWFLPWMDRIDLFLLGNAVSVGCSRNRMEVNAMYRYIVLVIVLCWFCWPRFALGTCILLLACIDCCKVASAVGQTEGRNARFGIFRKDISDRSRDANEEGLHPNRVTSCLAGIISPATTDPQQGVVIQPTLLPRRCDQISTMVIVSTHPFTKL